MSPQISQEGLLIVMSLYGGLVLAVQEIWFGFAEEFSKWELFP